MKLSSEAQSQYRLQAYDKAVGIDGVNVVELRRFHDECGSMVELLRLAQVEWQCSMHTKQW